MQANRRRLAFAIAGVAWVIGSAAAGAQERGDDGKLEEIVVTGTYIRGAEVTSPLIVLSREDIEAAGHSTVVQALHALPQNFGGGSNEVTTLVPGADATSGRNISLGSGMNLRGLGTDATLVLVNGRRVAPAGYADFVDISMLPLAAIERIDVLTDGASALYGADAVGGVVNIVLRSDFNGAETRLRGGTVTDGSSDELQFSQVYGRSWEGGNFVATYTYRDRDALASADRDYAADSDLRPFGGDDRSSIYSNPGNITNFVDTWAIPAGQSGDALEVGDLLPGQVNNQNIRRDTDLLPSQRLHGLTFAGQLDIGEVTTAYADIYWSRRDNGSRSYASSSTLSIPVTNPFYVNPYGSGPVSMRYSWQADLGPFVSSKDAVNDMYTLGLRTRFGSTWSLEATGSFGRYKTDYRTANYPNSFYFNQALADPDPATAFNPFGDGSFTPAATLDSIRGYVAGENKATLKSGDVRADGELVDLPAGPLRLAAGLHHRSERFARTTESFYSTAAPVYNAPAARKREVSAAFAEFYVPLLSDLALSLAGRYEDYSDFGSVVAPKAGLVWSPIEGLDLRASWGESFKAPLLQDLDDAANAYVLASILDPTSPSGRTLSLLLVGSSPGLVEETAETWTVGFDARPQAVPSLSFGANYFDVAYSDRVGRPDDISGVLTREDEYAAIITRNPAASVVDGYFADPAFRGAPVSADLVGAIIDARLTNVSRLEVRGIDLSASYGFDTAAGNWIAGLSASHLFDYQRAFSESNPLSDVGGTVGFPVEDRWRATLAWRRGGLSALAAVNHQAGYDDVVEERGVSSWTSVDLRVAWRGDKGVLEGTELALSVRNAFDEDPPFVNHIRGVGFDPANADPVGRFVSAELTYKW